MDRIKFYSTTDLGCGLMLQRIPRVIEKIDETTVNVDVNEFLEYYNTSLFINNELWLQDWSEEYREKLKSLAGTITERVARFFRSIEEKDFFTQVMQVGREYLDDYFHLLCKYGSVTKISWGTFSCALSNKPQILFEIFYHKELVDQFNEELRHILLSSPSNAELILSNTSMTIDQKKDRHFPKALTNEDINHLFLDYVNSLDPNFNYLAQIINFRSGQCKVKKEVKYAAKKRYDQLSERLIENGLPLEFKCSVSITPQKNQKIIHEEGNTLSLSYDSGWIKENLGFQDLLYNFVYLFEFLDNQFHVQLLSKHHSDSVIDFFVGGRNKTDYFVNPQFEMVNGIAEIQLRAYYSFLRETGIQLEDIFRWFYIDYLEMEYGIRDFHISLPSSNVSYLEKCKSIAPEFESILKQYSSLVKDKKIDQQYIENVQPNIVFTKLPSSCEENYAYPKSEKIMNAMFHLFSTQSMCYWLSEYGDENADCLFDQIRKHPIKYSSLNNWQIPAIDLLLELNILQKTIEEGVLQVVNLQLVGLLKQLYELGFVSTLNYHDTTRSSLDTLLRHDHLYTSSSLLSIQEGNYFNYCLNDSEFGNSLGLRNKYTHGTTSGNFEADYFTFLKLLVILTIKIDNDLQNSKLFIAG